MIIPAKNPIKNASMIGDGLFFLPIPAILHRIIEIILFGSF
jgi:hypothetical protein